MNYAEKHIAHLLLHKLFSTKIKCENKSLYFYRNKNTHLILVIILNLCSNYILAHWNKNINILSKFFYKIFPIIARLK